MFDIGFGKVLGNPHEMIVIFAFLGLIDKMADVALLYVKARRKLSLTIVRCWFIMLSGYCLGNY